MVQAALFWISFVYSGTLAVIAYPLIKTSHMTHEEFLYYLTKHQLYLRSEASRSCNMLLGDKMKDSRLQLLTLDAKITQLQIHPAHLKVLGVDVTGGSLGKFLVAVLGSLLSGLMKQAAED